MIVIRKAKPRDIPDLNDLLGALFAIEEDFQADEAKQHRGLALMIEDCGENRQILVAQVDGRVVGMVSAQLVISTAEGGPSALLEDLVVRKEHRGINIGARLLAKIEKWAGERGATRYQLLADRKNAPALAFYEKHGWHSTQLICLRKKLEGV